MRDYSWVFPVKDEAASLAQLVGEIQIAMKGRDFEIIAVDDASEDNSLSILAKLARKSQILRVIHLGTHQGKWAAVRRGLEEAKGEIIITLDSDLQDDPKEAAKLLAKLRDGYDLVSGWRKRRYDPFYKVAISKFGNWLVSMLSGQRYYDLNSPFKAYRQEAIANLPKHGSLLRFTMLFANKVGYKVSEVPIYHRPRRFGKSKFSIIKYLRIMYDLALVLMLFSGSGRIVKEKSS